MCLVPTGKVAFYARNAKIRSTVLDVIFRDVITNHGNGYSNTTGSFTAPLGGIYVFHLQYVLSSHYMLSSLVIQVNGQVICNGYIGDIDDQGTCSAVIQLQQGDVVNVKKSGTNVRLHWPEHTSSFSGFLYLPL